MVRNYSIVRATELGVVGGHHLHPDGHSALMLVAARLRHIASTKWGKRRYLAMETLFAPVLEEAVA